MACPVRLVVGGSVLFGSRPAPPRTSAPPPCVRASLFPPVDDCEAGSLVTRGRRPREGGPARRRMLPSLIGLQSRARRAARAGASCPVRARPPQRPRLRFFGAKWPQTSSKFRDFQPKCRKSSLFDAQPGQCTSCLEMVRPRVFGFTQGFGHDLFSARSARLHQLGSRRVKI